MNTLDKKIPFTVVVTDGLKTRFFKSEHLKNGRFKTISPLSEASSQELEMSEIISTLEKDEREQVVVIAAPGVYQKMTTFINDTNLELENFIHMSRNMMKRTTQQILDYIQKKDKFQLVKKEPQIN